jgi:hypothetical protein
MGFGKKTLSGCIAFSAAAFSPQFGAIEMHLHRFGAFGGLSR